MIKYSVAQGREWYFNRYFYIILSLETLNKYEKVHNDIKPQNYLVKWLNRPGDLRQIDIVLTDFGLVGQNTKGGTPIFASPECFSIKTNASDIFSLGRVFLFMMLPKESFLKFLFVPIRSSADTDYLTNAILNQGDLIGLIYAMMQTQKQQRIPIDQIRTKFNRLKRNSLINKNSIVRTEIERIVTQNLPPDVVNYISDLDHIS